MAGTPPRKVPSERNIDIVIDLALNSILWRNLISFANGKNSYKDIEIHQDIFNSSEVFKKEFIRGLADVTAYARKGNAYFGGIHRIYFEIHNANWKMPIQLCALLQGNPLSIPVQTIDWGHPNIRNGFAKEYNKGRENAWAREHQLKVFAEDFETIGFRIEHKNKILKEMADCNRELKPQSKNKLCIPPKKITKMKVDHPQEDSDKLPDEIRCKHFDAYWQVCKGLGCTQFED